jgi:hypothetical protein
MWPRRIASLASSARDAIESLGKCLVVRHAKGDSCSADLRLRPNEPLRHRRFGDEERAGDLGRRQPTEHPQRQRNLRVDREGGVAAGEDEGEPLVGDRAHVILLLNRLDQGEPLERGPLRLAA